MLINRFIFNEFTQYYFFLKKSAFGTSVFREMAAVLRQQLIPEILSKSCHPHRRARLSCPNPNKKVRSYDLESLYGRVLLPEETCAI